MIRLTNEQIKLIEEQYRGTRIRTDKMIYKHEKGMTTIPSKLYPLTNKKTTQVFSYFNSLPLEDDAILETFDSMKFPMGFCYQNTRDLYEALYSKGYTDLKMYVGWLLNGSYPVHHCWLVYKDQHVLDGGVGQIDLKVAETLVENPPESLDKAREIMARIHVESQSLPHHQTKTFGEVTPLYLYIGTECTPEDGRKTFQELMKQYPNHPSYSTGGMNGKGRSVTQTMIHDQLNKR